MSRDKVKELIKVWDTSKEQDPVGTVNELKKAVIATVEEEVFTGTKFFSKKTLFEYVKAGELEAKKLVTPVSFFAAKISFLQDVLCRSFVKDIKERKYDLKETFSEYGEEPDEEMMDLSGEELCDKLFRLLTKDLFRKICPQTDIAGLNNKLVKTRFLIGDGREPGQDTIEMFIALIGAAEFLQDVDRNLNKPWEEENVDI